MIIGEGSDFPIFHNGNIDPKWVYFVFKMAFNSESFSRYLGISIYFSVRSNKISNTIKDFKVSFYIRFAI